jgi:hypothetical protein
MILSQRQLEEIVASTTKDFNRFFFGDEADKPDRSALPTPIDQFARIILVFAYHSPVSRRTEASAVSLPTLTPNTRSRNLGLRAHWL